MTEVSKDQDIFKSKYSTGTHLSYGVARLVKQFLETAFTVRVFYYFENEILLPVLLVGIAYVLYGLWNMINDPLLGYFCDNTSFFLNRGGKRFPWIMIGILINIVFYLIIFIPFDTNVASNPWPVFVFFLVSICAFDGFFTLWTVNYFSLFPVKFRSNNERRIVNGMQTIFAQLGLFLGVILPPLFIEYGNKQSYFTAALVVGLVTLIFVVLSIKGVREDKELINFYIHLETEQQNESFFKNIKIALKQKNYMAHVISATLFNGFSIVALASVPYMVHFIFGLPADDEIILEVGLLLSGLLSVPIWTKLIKKSGTRKINIIGFFSCMIVVFFIFFAQDITYATIIMIIIGACVGSLWVAGALILSDVVDEIALKNKKRKEGIYYGFVNFFGRLEIVIQSLVFTAIHILFGFEAGAPTQNALAILGLRIQIAIFPMIFMLLGGLIFWKWYDLTPEHSKKIQEQLQELNL